MASNFSTSWILGSAGKAIPNPILANPYSFQFACAAAVPLTIPATAAARTKAIKRILSSSQPRSRRKRDAPAVSGCTGASDSSARRLHHSAGIIARPPAMHNVDRTFIRARRGWLRRPLRPDTRTHGYLIATGRLACAAPKLIPTGGAPIVLMPVGCRPTRLAGDADRQNEYGSVTPKATALPGPLSPKLTDGSIYSPGAR